MKSKLLVVLLLPLLPFSVFSKTKSLNSFDELMAVLKHGNVVHAVFHYGDCDLLIEGKVQDFQIDAVGGMPIETWEYFAKGAIRNDDAFVVASESKLIANPLGDGFVYNYVKLKVTQSGKVKITAKYLDVLTYEEHMSEDFLTSIAGDDSEGAAFFYFHD